MKTTQEQAEQLARKCAEHLINALEIEKHKVSMDEWLVTFNHIKGQEVIMKELPLLELLEVARAARDLNELMHMSSRPYWDRQELHERMKVVEATLQSLREKGVKICAT